MASSMHVSTSKILLEELKEKLNCSSRVMKKCFMTGKPCIFSFNIQAEMPKVFTVMQFSSNLDAFYDWSLKPFLTAFSLPEENIQRADKERGVRYIICEKICRKIQESQLIVADLSFMNPNVFYEIGLACGLRRPISFIKNKKSEDMMKNVCIKKTLNFIDENKILKFPGVEPMLVGDHKDAFLNSIHCNYLRPKIQKDKNKDYNISVLSFKLGDISNSMKKENEQLSYDEIGKKDIEVSITELVSGAINVAFREIREKILEKKSNNQHLEQWEDVAANKDDKSWEKFTKVCEVNVDCSDSASSKGNFENIRKKIHQSFCTIIDVSDNNPISYFWLGYCHAHGINVIPVNKTIKGKEEGLAFDIRALWYAEYNKKEPYKFKNIIREILEHLLESYLPDQHRLAFWDHFPAGSNIKVFMGAIHSSDHNREVVGDWDVRAVSELFSYLPTVRPTQLVTPLYSPEESWRQQHKKRNSGDEMPSEKEKADFIKVFCEQIREQLKDCSAIVIASPDVNPITEYVLYHTYSVKEGANPFMKKGTEKFDGFIAVKHAGTEGNAGIGKKDDNIKFNRLFYRQEPTLKLDGGRREPPNRGFVYHQFDGELQYRGLESEMLFQEYLSQDKMAEYVFSWNGILGRDKARFIEALAQKFDVAWGGDSKIEKIGDNTVRVSAGDKSLLLELNHEKTEVVLKIDDKIIKYDAKVENNELNIYMTGFNLLGHLVIARNPESRGNFVVLLNGVSGPATYAMAQILIGGGIRAESLMKSRSEEFLAKINEKLDDQLSSDRKGIEAILKFKIDMDNDRSMTYVDTRKVTQWEFLDESTFGPRPIN